MPLNRCVGHQHVIGIHRNHDHHHRHQYDLHIFTSIGTATSSFSSLLLHLHNCHHCHTFISMIIVTSSLLSLSHHHFHHYCYIFSTIITITSSLTVTGPKGAWEKKAWRKNTDFTKEKHERIPSSDPPALINYFNYLPFSTAFTH